MLNIVLTKALGLDALILIKLLLIRDLRHMALEVGTYLDDLVPSNPPQSDSLAQSAGHLRLIKSVLQNTFPNFDEPLESEAADIDEAVEIVQGGFYPPTGSMMDYGGSTEPEGWLFCNGQAVSRTTYAALFAVIGETFGDGDNVTTFRVPDRRDRVSIGKGNMGGASDIGIIDSLLDTLTLGEEYDGEGAIDTIALSSANIPAHTHSFSGSGTTGSGGSHSHTVSGTTSTDGSHTHSYTKPSGDSTAGSGPERNIITGTTGDNTGSGGSHSHSWSGTTSTHSGHTHTFSVSGTTGSSGSGTSFTVDILPPSLVVNVIIKT